MEAEQAAAAAHDEQRQVPMAAADEAYEAAPVEAVADGERQPPPQPRQPRGPLRSGGDAAADPSARKENLKRKEGRNTMDDIKREQNNAPLRSERASERACIFPKFELNSSK